MLAQDIATTDVAALAAFAATMDKAAVEPQVPHLPKQTTPAAAATTNAVLENAAANRVNAKQEGLAETITFSAEVMQGAKKILVRHKAAARTIQTWWRARSDTSSELQRRVGAVLKFQSMWRGVLVRRRYQNTKDALRLLTNRRDLATELAAAVQARNIPRLQQLLEEWPQTCATATQAIVAGGWSPTTGVYMASLEATNALTDHTSDAVGAGTTGHRTIAVNRAAGSDAGSTWKPFERSYRFFVKKHTEPVRVHPQPTCDSVTLALIEAGNMPRSKKELVVQRQWGSRIVTNNWGKWIQLSNPKSMFTDPGAGAWVLAEEAANGLAHFEEKRSTDYLAMSKDCVSRLDADVINYSRGEDVQRVRGKCTQLGNAGGEASPFRAATAEEEQALQAVPKACLTLLPAINLPAVLAVQPKLEPLLQLAMATAVEPTTLSLVAACSAFDVFDVLIESPCIDYTTPVDVHGGTVLHAFAAADDADAIDHILSEPIRCGHLLDRLDAAQCTPLMRAVHATAINAAARLLAAGSDTLFCQSPSSPRQALSDNSGGNRQATMSAQPTSNVSKAQVGMALEIICNPFGSNPNTSNPAANARTTRSQGTRATGTTPTASNVMASSTSTSPTASTSTSTSVLTSPSPPPTLPSPPPPPPAPHVLPPPPPSNTLPLPLPYVPAVCRPGIITKIHSNGSWTIAFDDVNFKLPGSQNNQFLVLPNVPDDKVSIRPLGWAAVQNPALLMELPPSTPKDLISRNDARGTIQWPLYLKYANTKGHGRSNSTPAPAVAVLKVAGLLTTEMEAAAIKVISPSRSGPVIDHGRSGNRAVLAAFFNSLLTSSKGSASEESASETQPSDASADTVTARDVGQDDCINTHRTTNTDADHLRILKGNGFCASTLAAHTHCTEAIELLAATGLDFNQPDSSGQTPLLRALALPADPSCNGSQTEPTAPAPTSGIYRCIHRNGVAFRATPSQQALRDVQRIPRFNDEREAIGLVDGAEGVKYIHWRSGNYSILVNPRNPTERYFEFVRSLDRAVVVGESVDVQAGPANIRVATEAEVAAAANTVDVLLQLGCLPNLPDQHGATPLMQAAYWKDVRLVRALLAAGAHPAIEDEYGTTAIAIAAMHGNTDCLHTLLAAGAAKELPHAPANIGSKELLAAAREGQSASVQMLLSAGVPIGHASEEIVKRLCNTDVLSKLLSATAGTEANGAAVACAAVAAGSAVADASVAQANTFMQKAATMGFELLAAPPVLTARTAAVRHLSIALRTASAGRAFPPLGANASAALTPPTSPDESSTGEHSTDEDDETMHTQPTLPAVYSKRMKRRLSTTSDEFIEILAAESDAILPVVVPTCEGNGGRTKAMVEEKEVTLALQTIDLPAVAAVRTLLSAPYTQQVLSAELSRAALFNDIATMEAIAQMCSTLVVGDAKDGQGSESTESTSPDSETSDTTNRLSWNDPSLKWLAATLPKVHAATISWNVDPFDATMLKMVTEAPLLVPESWREMVAAYIAKSNTLPLPVGFPVQTQRNTAWWINAASTLIGEGWSPKPIPKPELVAPSLPATKAVDAAIPSDSSVEPVVCGAGGMSVPSTGAPATGWFAGMVSAVIGRPPLRSQPDSDEMHIQPASPPADVDSAIQPPPPPPPAASSRTDNIVSISLLPTDDLGWAAPLVKRCVLYQTGFDTTPLGSNKTIRKQAVQFLLDHCPDKCARCGVCDEDFLDSSPIRVSHQTRGSEHFKKAKCTHAYCADCLKQWINTNIDQNMAHVLCPHPECAVSMYEDDVKRIAGDDAHKKFCALRHANHSERLLELMKDKKLFGEVSKDAKPCPKCNVVINKFAGCDSMLCSCGNTFNWRSIGWPTQDTLKAAIATAKQKENLNL
jgi:hypothetical protein